MIVVNSLLPDVQELESVAARPQIRAIWSDCSRGEGQSTLHYNRYGHTVQQNLPFSLRWTASYLLGCMSTYFDNCYSRTLGRMFVHWAQERHVQNLTATKAVIPINHKTQQCYLKLEHVVLKGHMDHPQARGFMERLVWDCAKLLEVEDFFVPTAMTRQGCVQPRIQGQELGDFVDDGGVLRFDVLMRALMSCVIMGIYDGFADNIIVDTHGVPHFVDNVRCFPHSNDFIRVGQTLMPATRCGLLEFEECYKKLSSDEKEQLFELFSTLKMRIPEVDLYLKNVDKRSLPPHWFDEVPLLTSLYQRVSRLEIAFKEDRILCLRDIVFSAHPYYRFAAALALIQYSKRPQHTVLGGFFGEGFDFKRLVFKNSLVDVVALWHACSDPSRYFDDIIKSIQPKPDAANRKAIQRVWESILRIAALDYKDFNYVASSESQQDPAAARPHRHGGGPSLSDRSPTGAGSAVALAQHR